LLDKKFDKENKEKLNIIMRKLHEIQNEGVKEEEFKRMFECEPIYSLRELKNVPTRYTKSSILENQTQLNQINTMIGCFVDNNKV